MEILALQLSDDFFLETAQKMFQPLLLFFYLGFLIPILKVPYEFPKQIYQGITLYLLVAIGWHGGEELARMGGSELQEALGFAAIGFMLNACIGLLAYFLLRMMTRMRRIDAATVGGYYGSDSAGTFLTCAGVLMLVMGKDYTIGYMPVMLAVMETPGCLVCLYQIARLRRQGLDKHGNMPDEVGYDEPTVLVGSGVEEEVIAEERGGGTAVMTVRRSTVTGGGNGAGYGEGDEGDDPDTPHANRHGNGNGNGKPASLFSWEIVHEVFFNPGLYFLFGGVIIGFIVGWLFIGHGKTAVIKSEDELFVTLMHGVLCLFLLDMGITASRRLGDLKQAGVGFVFFGLLAPNLFAIMGITATHLYSTALGHPFPISYYALFAVLCAAASYIAVPAVQRMAIPEASPTLPLAASLGLTFTYNVTLGIPIYIAMATYVMQTFPVTG